MPDLDPAVAAKVTTKGKKAQIPAQQYLRRCVTELGARPQEPTSGGRPGIKLNPPAGVRVASIYVPSGRVAFRDPKAEEAADLDGAAIVENNGIPG